MSRDRVDRLIEEATVDCYDESEQAMGLFTMLEENLALPFETEVLGVRVEVVGIELGRRGEILAICGVGRHRQRVPLLDVRLPRPPPEGAVWIEAYRQWANGP